MQIYSDKIFKNPVDIIDAPTSMSVFTAFEKIEKLYKRYYLLGYVSYDFKRVYFEVFDKFEKYNHRSIDKPFGIISKPMISKEEYFASIDKIKNYISEGVSYEVNFTYPNKVLTNLDDLELYEALLERQKTPYNLFFKNKYTTLLSFSPELFFRLQGNKIFTKPMKGTIQRGQSKIEDEKNFEFLQNDIKNRAENIMIVDLLRNDLGRIAKTGSVKVDKLFEIEAHPTVFQMTSEISAQLRDNIKLFDIFKAIFPCGSITGAPKISTMKVIKELEKFSREIYCGAIGFLSPEECVFSVPIRILQSKNPKLYGVEKKSAFFKYSVGGAIVWDSTPEDEWNETLTKMKFLQTDFSLIETAIDNWSEHVKRMKNSAEELGFIWNDNIENLEINKGKVLRVVLNKNGDFTTTYNDLKPRPCGIDGKYKIKICGKVHSSNPFLYHKTTIRNKSPEDIFDYILSNENDEITEGTFTNIAILADGKLYTPPVNCGLLNGTLRKQYIEDGKMIERILYKKDLLNAEKIYCFNSVRGFVEVELC